jgi:hypothetical protein
MCALAHRQGNGKPVVSGHATNQVGIHYTLSSAALDRFARQRQAAHCVWSCPANSMTVLATAIYLAKFRRHVPTIFISMIEALALENTQIWSRWI